MTGHAVLCPVLRHSRSAIHWAASPRTVLNTRFPIPIGMATTSPPVAFPFPVRLFRGRHLGRQTVNGLSGKKENDILTRAWRGQRPGFSRFRPHHSRIRHARMPQSLAEQRRHRCESDADESERIPSVAPSMPVSRCRFSPFRSSR